MSTEAEERRRLRRSRRLAFYGKICSAWDAIDAMHAGSVAPAPWVTRERDYEGALSAALRPAQRGLDITDEGYSQLYQRHLRWED